MPASKPNSEMAAPARQLAAPGLDFAVIGAAKAGTTALFGLLRTHPQLYLPEAKELPYFITPRHAYYDSAAGFFADTFEDRSEGQLCGTVTPQYLYGALIGPDADQVPPQGPRETIVPARIREAYPEARLIAILRDPVARARSHHRMSAMRGMESHRFDAAIDELLRPEALAHSRARPGELSGYVVLGEYGRLLQGYFDVFGPEQLLVLFHDDLKRDPAAVCARVFAFLGVDSEFTPPNLGQRYNEAAGRRRFALLDLTRWQLAAGRSAALKRLWRLVPRSLRLRVLERFNVASRRLFLWNRVRVEDAGADPDPASAETLARLQEHYRADGRRLEELLGVSPPWQETEPGSGP